MRREICCLSRANGVINVVSGPMVSIGALLAVVSGWLTSVELFAAVPLGVGSGDTL